MESALLPWMHLLTKRLAKHIQAEVGVYEVFYRIMVQSGAHFVLDTYKQPVKARTRCSLVEILDISANIVLGELATARSHLLIWVSLV